MSTDDFVFELRSARVSLDSTLVLNRVDFKLSSGEFLALLGSNGSGKTTLVRALLRLVALEDGEARIFGQPMDAFKDWFRVGYVPQRVSALSGAPASVMEVVLSGRIGRSRRFRRYRASDRLAAAHALDSVGMASLARVPLARLSGGQQQRVLIARALVAEPDVLVLDEPLSGVDLEHQEELAGTLEEMNERGETVLLVAHGLGSMEKLITREVVMHAGKVTYDGPHLPHHVHADDVHHPEGPPERSPLDRAVGGH